MAKKARGKKNKRDLGFKKAADKVTKNLITVGVKGALVLLVEETAKNKIQALTDSYEEALLSQILDERVYPELASSITKRKNKTTVIGANRDLVDTGELFESVTAKADGEIGEIYADVEFAEALNDYIGFFDQAVASVDVRKILER